MLDSKQSTIDQKITIINKIAICPDKYSNFGSKKQSWQFLDFFAIHSSLKSRKFHQNYALSLFIRPLLCWWDREKCVNIQ
jgi:hypothetical protein